MIACAGLMSVVLSAMSMLIVLWAVDLQHPKPGDLSTFALVFLGPILSPLVFALVFVSRRWHRRFMWLFAFGTFIGVYFEEERRWIALRNPSVLVLIAIASLVEISYRLKRKPIQARSGSFVPE